MKVENHLSILWTDEKRKKRWCFVYPRSLGVVGPHRWLILLLILVQLSSSAVVFISGHHGGLMQPGQRLATEVHLKCAFPLILSISFSLFLNHAIFHHFCCFSPKRLLSIFLWENMSPSSIAGNKICNPFSTQQPGWACKISPITSVPCLKPPWLFIDLKLKAKLLIISYKCLHDLAPMTLQSLFTPLCSLTSSHTGLLCIFNQPNSFLRGHFLCLAALICWPLTWLRSHSSNVLLRKTFADHSTESSMFPPYPVTIPSPCLSAWNSFVYFFTHLHFRKWTLWEKGPPLSNSLLQVQAQDYHRVNKCMFWGWMNELNH